MKNYWDLLVDVLQFVWNAVNSYAGTPEGSAKIAEILSDLRALETATATEAPVAATAAGRKQ